jgi:hypothetical protein
MRYFERHALDDTPWLHEDEDQDLNNIQEYTGVWEIDETESHVGATSHPTAMRVSIART